MLNGDKPLPQVTASELRDILLLHARASKSRSLSYQDVAVLIGRLVLIGGVGWWLLGFPGVPPVHDWWWRTLVPRETVIGLGAVGGALLLLTLEVYRWSALCPDDLRGVLGKPKELLGDLLHAVRLLLGIATVGLAAIVPGAYLVFLLGLNGP